MRNYIFLIALILFSCKEKDENLDLKYEVLNQLIKKDNEVKSDLKYLYRSYSATDTKIVNLDVESVNVLFEPINYSIKLRSDSIFPTKDIEYLSSQTIPYNSKIFDLDENKITGEYEILKKADLDDIINNYKGADDYWAKFNKKFSEKCVRTYSEPIFNLQKDICIVIISESCGPLWGGGYTAIYKKTNGKWEIIKTLDQWVS